MEQIEFVYWNAGKFKTETRMLIKGAVEGCEICKNNGRYKSRPSIAIPRVTLLYLGSKGVWKY